MKRSAIIWIAILVVDLILVFLNKSTFDSGDSVLHFIESNQAWQSPEYFMDMWSKPVFVLLSSPFATLGWWGMKLFNSLCMLGSAYLCYKIFIEFKFNGWWGVFISFFAYSFFLVQSSGLTEPLFTFCLTAIILLEIKDKTAWSMVILSFLPFVRAEGWIIGIIVLVYLLLSRKHKYIPHILLGTLCYGIIGLFVYQDFLWMFHQNPYAGEEVKYGSGDLLHYLTQLPYVIGLPIYILFILGVVRGGILFFKGLMNNKEFFLIYGITIGYITAHSIFWKFGLFHSFGMSRVLIVIIPLISFIAYRGIDWIVCSLHFVSKSSVLAVLIGTITVFPFIDNKMAIRFPLDVNLTSNQKTIDQAANWLSNNQLNNRSTYTNAYFLSLAMNRPLDNDKHVITMDRLKKGQVVSQGIVVWDSYFAESDSEVSEKYLSKKLNANRLKEFTNDEGYRIVIYQLP